MSSSPGRFRKSSSMDQPRTGRAPKLASLRQQKTEESSGNFLQVPGVVEGLDTNERRSKLKKRSVSIGATGKSKSISQDEQTLAEEIGLNSYQMKMLIQTWPQIYKTGGASTGSGIFTGLCAMNSNAKELFQLVIGCKKSGSHVDGAAAFVDTKFDIRSEHAKLVLETLDTTIKTFLDTPTSNAVEYFKNYGASHRHLRRLGFNSKVWDDFGESILNHVRQNNVVRKHKELARAWAALISFVVDKLKCGQTSYGYKYFRSCEDLRHKWHSFSSVSFDETHSTPPRSPVHSATAV